MILATEIELPVIPVWSGSGGLLRLRVLLSWMHCGLGWRRFPLVFPQGLAAGLVVIMRLASGLFAGKVWSLRARSRCVVRLRRVRGWMSCAVGWLRCLVMRRGGVLLWLVRVVSGDVLPQRQVQGTSMMRPLIRLSRRHRCRRVMVVVVGGSRGGGGGHLGTRPLGEGTSVVGSARLKALVLRAILRLMPRISV
ncbi:hypothetical protein ALI144C_25975 [Actinosynnema sp. ALI-1.44]|nr:hypothetical protein ALI144C_25975 [Actinosynnema sp. ALI-1.44]